MKKLINKKGVGYVDSGVKILIAIVIGVLILIGLYALTNETVLPAAKTKIEGLLDYSGPVAVAPIAGDIDGSGVVDSADLDILTSELLNISGNYDESVLDVNGDGTLNVFDSIRLKKIITANNAS